MKLPITLLLFLLLMGVLVVGCAENMAVVPTARPTPVADAPTALSSPTPSPTGTPTPTPVSEPDAPDKTSTSTVTPSPLPPRSPEVAAVTPTRTYFAYTHQQPDGNRLVAGQGDLPNAAPVDIPLAGVPQWLVAAPAGEGTLWTVVLVDGQVQAFRIAGDGQVEPANIAPTAVLAGLPPLLRVEGGSTTLPLAIQGTASTLTHPLLFPEQRTLVAVGVDGQLVVRGQATVTELPVAPLPDARLLADEQQRLLFLSDPTERYRHGVLGDVIEAGSITLVELVPRPAIATTISIPEPSVVEGLAPIWTDLTGDGQREIIVTLSNSEQGARIVVFDESGEQIAAGPAIGQGGRWRHQLAVAPFGPNGELELVDVLTPHIGGTVEFYRLEGNTLRIVATLPGYTSHVSGSRNLDMALAGDLDGDARIELLLPNQQRTALGAVRRTTAGAEVAWTLPLDGVLATNLAGVTLPDGRLAVGAGREDGLLRVWGP